MPSEEDRTTATGNMHTNFGKFWLRGFRVKRADRQTNKRIHYNIPHRHTWLKASKRQLGNHISSRLPLLNCYSWPAIRLIGREATVRLTHECNLGLICIIVGESVVIIDSWRPAVWTTLTRRHHALINTCYTHTHRMSIVIHELSIPLHFHNKHELVM